MSHKGRTSARPPRTLVLADLALSSISRFTPSIGRAHSEDFAPVLHAISEGFVPSAIPAHARQVSTVRDGSTLTIIYRAGKTDYRVRFAADGRYTLARMRAPHSGSPRAQKAGQVLAGRAHSVSISASSQQTDGLPLLPLLLIGVIAAAGVGARQFVIARRRS